ncbi:MAG: hypothetical protein FWG05_01405 [Kiritimatiellaeota bacterium]|nr:hypothetical protein [Kiritimatiellota bacterium]
MKAKFGKASIACFVGVFCFIFIAVLSNASDRHMYFAFAVYAASGLAGLASAIIGLTKDSPKAYSITGFILNLGWLCVLAWSALIAPYH